MRATNWFGLKGVVFYQKAEREKDSVENYVAQTSWILWFSSFLYSDMTAEKPVTLSCRTPFCVLGP